jgi:hypothetical protein
LAQEAFQIKVILEAHGESSRDCSELRHVRWQQLATDCLLGALLAELIPILSPAANRHEEDDGGWINREGR